MSALRASKFSNAGTDACENGTKCKGMAMSEWVKLTASDGNEMDAYVVRPKGEPKAALVVVQEIFGVNKNIQLAADEWASHGFLVIAPQMFDRFEKSVDLGYDKAGWAEAMRLAGQFAPDMQPQTVDVDAAIDWLRNETEANVGVVGYCFGGTMAWLSACRLKIEAAVGFYGGSIVNFAQEKPQAPVMLHFGGQDEHIPAEAIGKIQSAHPEIPIFVYENAGHAFARSVDPKAYVADAAALATKRSVLFFEQHLVF
ncbi:dienelactone hydrolase-like enzyme [Terriglobus roseus DSM 18391]|uniref:Dienelactone hydrolase-like enzyme n=2 Tax=Terriglobus roseus TaxID=392734 RepID=I3ZCL5_TERRK|nr:dienelactone hydrolase-like enzyme [Terriglobus roseus DSM 18391]